MKNKRNLSIVGFFVVVCMLVMEVFFVYDKCNTNKNTANACENQTNTIWKKKDKFEKTFVNCAEKQDFDLQEISEDADYVFRGIVEKCEEYEVEWKDENNEQWGPYPSSVVTVNINEEYYGNSPVSGTAIKVYYPFDVSMEFYDGFTIKEGNEYIFVSKALDEEFVKRRNLQNPEDKFEQEKYADVYISDTGYDLMAVEGEKVVLYQDYCYWDDEILEQTVTGEAVSKEMEEILPSEEVMSTGDFVMLKKCMIYELIDKIFRNTHEMLNAEELKQLHMENTNER